MFIQGTIEKIIEKVFRVFVIVDEKARWYS